MQNATATALTINQIRAIARKAAKRAGLKIFQMRGPRPSRPLFDGGFFACDPSVIDEREAAAPKIAAMVAEIRAAGVRVEWDGEWFRSILIYV